MAGGCGATSAAFAVGAREPPWSRLDRDRTLSDAFSGALRAVKGDGHRRRSEPLTGRKAPPHADSRDGDRGSDQVGDAPPADNIPAQTAPRAPSLPVRRAHNIRLTGAHSAAGSTGRSPATMHLCI